MVYRQFESMKQFFLPIFIMLLYNCCLSEPIRNFGSQEDQTQIPSESRNGSNSKYDANHTDESKMELMDLNTDCKYKILEQLELIDLMEMAKVTPEFASLAENVFRRKYSFKVVTAKIWPYSGIRGLFEITSTTSEPCLEIRDFNLTLNVFKYFGSAIRKLEIKSRFLDSDSNIINRMISKYLSKSLIEIDFGFIGKDDTFGAMPFENVEYLKFTITTNWEPSKDMPLDKLFPKLRQLDLHMYFDIDYSFIGCELPHLESVRIGVASGVLSKLNQINGLFRKNPQIRSVVVDWSRSDHIIHLSKLLPNLQNLTFFDRYEMNIQNETVHFENVEMFSISTSPSSGSLENLTFSKLKNLTLAYNFRGERNIEWIAFFKRHQSICELHLSVSSTRRDLIFPLVEFTADLINLTDVTVKSKSGFSFAVISNFIQNHEKLNKFRFPTDEPHKSNLMQHFQHDWHIQVVDDSQSILLFERKTTHSSK